MYATALARIDASTALQHEHADASTAWSILSEDLSSLAPFKERLATYHLLQRTAESVPRWQLKRRDAKVSDTNAAERIAQILARSSKDIDTDRTIIPNKFHDEYEHLLDQRDDLSEQMARLDAALDTAAAQVRSRLASRASLGLAGVPLLRSLPPLPEHLAGLAPEISDEALMAMVRELESRLGVELLNQRPTSPTDAPEEPRVDFEPPPVPEMWPDDATEP